MMKGDSISSFDPLYKLAGVWNYLIPTSAIRNGCAIDDLRALQRAMQANSVAQAVCLTKLAWFGSRAIMAEVLTLESCTEDLFRWL